jgi:hypothetical protein
LKARINFVSGFAPRKTRSTIQKIVALFFLALHGPTLCYVQIGGLILATVVTKLQVPVMYAILVPDLKILKLETKEKRHRQLRPLLLLIDTDTSVTTHGLASARRNDRENYPSTMD